MTEYLVILALIAIACITIAGLFGQQARLGLARAVKALAGEADDGARAGEIASRAEIETEREPSLGDFARGANPDGSSQPPETESLGQDAGASGPALPGTRSVVASDGTIIPIFPNAELPPDTQGRLSFDPSTGQRVIYVNPRSPYPEDAVVQHELTHYENELKGMTDQTIHEISATRAGYEYALAQYRKTGDKRYLDYARYQASKHNTLLLPGMNYPSGTFSSGQLLDDLGNIITGNGSDESFIRIPAP